MATVEQMKSAVEALEKYGTQKKAARALKIGRRTIQRHLKAAKENGFLLSQEGFDPSLVPYYWKKTKEGSFFIRNQEAEEQSRLEEIKKGFFDELPRAEANLNLASYPKNSDLLNCYVITDYHLGMLAWGEETGGDDWDLGIAEDLLVKWFQMAIAQSPTASEAVFMQLGDFFHYDSLESVTPAHKNILDADSRPQKMVRVATRVIRKIIDMLLEEYDKVSFYNVEGNHDPFSSAMYREMWKMHYENEPRVWVDDTAQAYHFHQFGDVSLFMHHGHKRPTKNIDHVFAAKFRDLFGRTKFSYAHTGHKHSHEIIETNLMIIEQHPTLAPEDDYASRGGYMHKRAAHRITYHRKYGEVSRDKISPEMVR